MLAVTHPAHQRFLRNGSTLYKCSLIIILAQITERVTEIL